MPKLPSDRAEGAGNQEEREAFQVLPGKRYVYKLTEVDDSEVTGPNSKAPGTDKWVFKLQVDKDFHPELRKGSWQTGLFEHIPLTESMDWKLNQLFTAFGYTTDSDTDEIIEDPDARCVAYVFADKSYDPDAPQMKAKKYVAFDPAKWTKVPEVEEDDNQ